MENTYYIEQFFGVVLVWFLLMFIILYLGKKLFRFRDKTMYRLTTISFLGLLVYIAIASGDGGFFAGIFMIMIVVLLIYTVIMGVLGVLYRFVGGGKKLTLTKVVMFLIGFIGTGKLIKMSKMNKDK